MTITGLENNYYLSQNDIWISVSGFSENVSYLEITPQNLTSSLTIDPLKLYPSPNNDFQFNICQIVRALFPETDHINNNNLQSFKFDFVAKFIDTEIEDETITIQKYFIRGGRDKNANDEWYLTSSEELVIGKWIEWIGITLPGYAKRIQGTKIVDYIPNNPYKKNLQECDYKIVKFLNSVGGYQFYVFEKFEIKTKSKAGKTIPKNSVRLRNDNFRNIGIEIEKTIELQTKTPFEIQSVITDLISSFEVLLFHPEGLNDAAKWQRLNLESNDSVENNYDRMYENKIEFSFSNYRTIAL